jgi:hypothetical protein
MKNFIKKLVLVVALLVPITTSSLQSHYCPGHYPRPVHINLTPGESLILASSMVAIACASIFIDYLAHKQGYSRYDRYS